MRHRTLYLIVLAGLLFVVAAAMGNGLLNRPADYSSWNYRVFSGICHQLPDRSLLVRGTPMAVNARCFGIFSALLAIWLLLPWLASKVTGKRWPVWLLIAAIALQLVDYSASMLSVWNSSNFSRFFLGALLGAAVVITMGEFFSVKKPIK